MTKNILIVEDNPLLAETYVSIVEDMLDCNGLTASSTGEAFSLLEVPIRLALLDVEVTDGVTYSLAAHILKRNIPVVFVSGSDPAKVPGQLARIPFLRKPILPSALLAAARPYL
jgi:CheY-like chemotaxis protein